MHVRNGIERSSFWLPFLVHCPNWFVPAMPKTITMSTPSDSGLQVSLHILGHELICLSCWMNWIIPYLDPKLDCLEMTSFEVRMQLHAFNLSYDHSRSFEPVLRKDEKSLKCICGDCSCDGKSLETLLHDEVFLKRLEAQGQQKS